MNPSAHLQIHNTSNGSSSFSISSLAESHYDHSPQQNPHPVEQSYYEQYPLTHPVPVLSDVSNMARRADETNMLMGGVEFFNTYQEDNLGYSNTLPHGFTHQAFQYHLRTNLTYYPSYSRKSFSRLQPPQTQLSKTTNKITKPQRTLLITNRSTKSLRKYVDPEYLFSGQNKKNVTQVDENIKPATNNNN